MSRQADRHDRRVIEKVQKGACGDFHSADEYPVPLREDGVKTVFSFCEQNLRKADKNRFPLHNIESWS